MEISKWVFTQTVREIVCPRCGQQSNESCRTPKGRKTNKPHTERCTAYRKKIGYEEFMRRHTVKAIRFTSASNFWEFLKNKRRNK